MTRGKITIEQKTGLGELLARHSANCIVSGKGFRIRPGVNPDNGYNIIVKSDPKHPINRQTREYLYAVLDGLPEEVKDHKMIEGDSYAAMEAIVYLGLKKEEERMNQNTGRRFYNNLGE